MCVRKIWGQTREKLKHVPVIGGLIEPKPLVSVIRLSGVITDTMMRRQTISFTKLERAIETAFDLHNLKAVALVINCPGGSPAQSALIGHHIRRLAEKNEKPVYAFVEDVAASGGYWLACSADKIYAQNVSIVGSIGVISSSFGFQKLIEKQGVERRIHTSGTNKSFMDPFLEENPADVKRLKSIQNELHSVFIDWVKSRRGDRLHGTKKTLFEGQFWSGNQALEKGLIDGIGDLKHICREEFGDDIKFIEFGAEKKFLSSLIGGETSLPEDAIEMLEKRTIWARYGL